MRKIRFNLLTMDKIKEYLGRIVMDEAMMLSISIGLSIVLVIMLVWSNNMGILLGFFVWLSWIIHNQLHMDRHFYALRLEQKKNRELRLWEKKR